MHSIRRGGAALARQIRTVRRTQQSRSYASGGHHGEGGHGHHAAPAVEESMGTAFYIGFGAVPAAVLLYYATRPGPQGESSSITKFFERISNFGKEWEERNNLHTVAIEQAAQDKNLLYNVERNKHVELRFPEVFQQGSPYNVPAGHYVNMDKVIAHYKQQHLDEEARKAKKLPARSSE